MKRLIPVALLTALLAGCAHDSPCVPVYDDQGRLVHTNTCMKGTTQDNWETAGAIAGGAAATPSMMRCFPICGSWMPGSTPSWCSSFLTVPTARLFSS